MKFYDHLLLEDEIETIYELAFYALYKFFSGTVVSCENHKNKNEDNNNNQKYNIRNDGIEFIFKVIFFDIGKQII